MQFEVKCKFTSVALNKNANSFFPLICSKREHCYKKGKKFLPPALFLAMAAHWIWIDIKRWIKLTFLNRWKSACGHRFYFNSISYRSSGTRFMNEIALHWHKVMDIWTQGQRSRHKPNCSNFMRRKNSYYPSFGTMWISTTWKTCFMTLRSLNIFRMRISFVKKWSIHMLEGERLCLSCSYWGNFSLT